MDAEQIRKVVTNLLANAVEATADNRDRPREIRVGLTARDSLLEIEVADNGCGMTPEYQSRSLFRPFQTTKNKGIGIGLFLSKRIVEAHGGALTVESELGKGTAVRIGLPARTGEST
jgi:signal transduction histidine kinase